MKLVKSFKNQGSVLNPSIIKIIKPATIKTKKAENKTSNEEKGLGMLFDLF